MTTLNRIQWLSDLVRVEIALWNHIDARLRQEHDVSLAFFESIRFIGNSPEGSLRVGDLARSLSITVGATSKLVDRLDAAGLIRREPDADDRRASRVALTETGRQSLVAASATCTAELAALLDPALSVEEQQLLHTLLQRLLAAVQHGESL